MSFIAPSSAPIFPRFSRKKRDGRDAAVVLAAALSSFSFLLGFSPDLSAAPLCPGPVQNPRLLLSPPGSARETPERLLDAARILRDFPGGKAGGEEALARVRKMLLALPEAERLRPDRQVLFAERDTQLVLYRGFPGGMHYGKRAEATLDRLLRQDPSLARGHLLKGIALYYKPWFVGGSVKKALKEFELANRLSPSDPRILSWIGVARHRLGVAGARAAMRQLRALCPASPFYRVRAETFDPRAPHP